LREARRGAIIEAAYTVLTERGYERTLMSDVARQAGVANGTVYRYFDSKRELLDHIFDYAVAKAVNALDIGSVTDQAADADGDPLDLITAFGTRLFALIDEDPAIIRVLTVESNAIDAELRWRVVGLFAAMDANLALLFERFSAQPDTGRDVWTLLGRMVVGMAGPGLTMSLTGEGSADERAEFLTTMQAVAARGLFDLSDGDLSDGDAAVQNRA
jgi:AcrR family transcriptional regulator